MPVRTLFEMTLGETLFLNAKLPTGKEFMPREISLLIGEEGNPLSSQEILEGGESLILSEVAEPPAQMIDSLTTLFKTIKPVKRAFICSIKENEEAQPNLLIGIEAVAMRELGVNQDKHLIVYDEGNLFSAPRAWWMLRTFGVEKVSILGGGLAGWQRDDLLLEKVQ